MNREILVVGVPWNLHELGAVTQDAESLGLRVHVVDTESALAKVDTAVGCGRIPVPELGVDAVSAAGARLSPHTVLSVTERQLVLAAEVRERLGLPGTSRAAELRVRDKFLMRQALREAGLTRVGFLECALEDVSEAVARLGPPVVVKPRTLAGSTAVHLVAEPGDITAVSDYYLHGSPMRGSVLVEEFIPGREVSFEGLAVEGRLTRFAVTDKINTGAPNFFEVGHLMPALVDEPTAGVIESFLQDVVKALGIETAPIHAEVKISGSHFELIEIHTRFGGGNIVQLLEKTYHIRPFKSYLGALIGHSPPRVDLPKATFGVGFFTVHLGDESGWQNFDFPHPEAVLSIDYDRQRSPKAETIDGVRMQRWRCGHAMFRSDHPETVRKNIEFMYETFMSRR